MTSSPWFIGIDVGASGSRALAVRDDGETLAEATGSGAVATGNGAPEAVMGALAALLARVPPGEPAHGVAVGSTGLGTLGGSISELRSRIRDATGTDAVVVAIDAVTSHSGALEGRAGVTVAAGTGAITLAEDASGLLHRIDGWGHLLGDRGSAAWIGIRGLATALEHRDGTNRDGAALLARAVSRFGAPLTWPAAVYGRDDRAAVLGAFATEVTDLAVRGDSAATSIAFDAAGALAASARAGLAIDGVPAVVAVTGGVFASSIVRERFEHALGSDVLVASPRGSAVDGAIRLARSKASGRDRPSVPGLLLW